MSDLANESLVVAESSVDAIVAVDVLPVDASVDEDSLELAVDFDDSVPPDVEVPVVSAGEEAEADVSSESEAACAGDEVVDCGLALLVARLDAEADFAPEDFDVGAAR